MSTITDEFKVGSILALNCPEKAGDFVNNPDYNSRYLIVDIIPVVEEDHRYALLYYQYKILSLDGKDKITKVLRDEFIPVIFKAVGFSPTAQILFDTCQ